MPKSQKSKKVKPTSGQVNPLSIQPSRYQRLDILRGIAIGLMIFYHFFFDLNYFAVATFDFNNDLFWLSARVLILSLFLGLVGVGLQLFYERGLNIRGYLRRLGLITLAAGLVSFASYLMFPNTLIFFGVLHFIAVASVVALAFVRFYTLNLALGVMILLAGLWFKHPFFDQAWAQWIGFMTFKPLTEDYVPIFPWFGVVLIGLFLGKLLLSAPQLKAKLRKQTGHKLGRFLAAAGRHSLLIYLIHQPLLIALIYFFTRVR